MINHSLLVFCFTIIQIIDLAINNKSTNHVIICEFTVPFKINIESVRERKPESYTQLSSNIMSLKKIMI